MSISRVTSLFLLSRPVMQTPPSAKCRKTQRMEIAISVDSMQTNLDREGKRHLADQPDPPHVGKQLLLKFEGVRFRSRSITE